MAKNVKLKELCSMIRTNKKVTALFVGFILTLVLLIILTITLTCTIKKTADNTANEIFDRWVEYEYEIVKYSTLFCNQNRYSVVGTFNDDNCFSDCAQRCLATGYRYKSHIRDDSTCSFGCSCECV